MSKHHRLVVSPSSVAKCLPLSLRPHFIFRVDDNGQVFKGRAATRWGAVREAREIGDELRLWVHVHDDETPARIIRTYPPRVTR